ncbi:deoxynucleoside kinase isoform X2 [Orussus abietinus]|nr:deoxynucleoside kinase isoform X2 [Orussus abietinus]XP_012276036.1 deoxynucleoside kinase isoform X2 [Orussus abietinus]
MSRSPVKVFNRPFTVCVEGNIGSGKTTFLSHFRKYDNTTVLQEPIELWRNVGGTNLLDLMYKNPGKYSFLFQSYVQLTMLQLHAQPCHRPYKVMERSVYSACCFIENMRRTKVLEDVETKVLNEWYDFSLKETKIETDLIVYLRTTPEVVYERMQARGRKEETSVSLEYLRQIHQIHDEWLKDGALFKLPAPVMILDGDKSLNEMVHEFELCRESIYLNQEPIDDRIIKRLSIVSQSPGMQGKVKAGASS